MQFDWNIEEINALKHRASMHAENKLIARQLERLESHLKSHRNSRSFELRKKIWDAVEECAIDLDTLIDTLQPR